MKINVTNNIKNKNIDVSVNECSDGSLTIVINEKPNKKHLGDIDVGRNIRIGEFEFIVLEHNSDGTRVISKDFAFNKVEFGECNDWRVSPIRTQLLGQEYYEKICKVVDKHNIIPMTRDLTSLDGLDDFGTCIDVVSMFTASEYAKYHKILGVRAQRPDWWYLITPASTPSNGYDRAVCYVDNATIEWNGCGNWGNVRPFLTLKSSISVKEL